MLCYGRQADDATMTRTPTGKVENMEQSSATYTPAELEERSSLPSEAAARRYDALRGKGMSHAEAIRRAPFDPFLAPRTWPKPKSS